MEDDVAKVLVVDDDEDIRRLVKTRIEGKGHQVVACPDGPTALRLVAERGAPDVCVLDVSMPDMTGLDLCTRLRELVGNPDLPVIFLSARVNPEDIERGHALGAAYLTKPLVATALLNAIDSSLDTGPVDGW